MKNIRKLECVITAVLLVACMAVPASAEVNGSGTLGSYKYNWWMDLSEVEGEASMAVTTTPTYVTVSLSCTMYNSDTGRYYGVPGSNTGYVSVYVFVDVGSEASDVVKIVGANADYYINSTKVQSCVL